MWRTLVALCRCGCGHPRSGLLGWPRVAVPWWPGQCRWPPASPLLSWCPSWPWQPREWMSWDAAVPAACRVQERPCSRPPKQTRDQGHAAQALLLQRTCHRGPPVTAQPPPCPVQAGEEGCSAMGSSKPSVTVINWLASTRDSCDVPRTRTAVRRHSLGCSPLCDTRLPRGAGGLRGCLPGPEQDGEGGGRHWEQGPAPRSPGSLCVLANRASLSGS